MNVIDVTEQTFEEQVLRRSAEVPVVVDFWASWCGPCRVLSPLLERLAEEANGGWILAKIDVDANQNLAAAYQVQGIPAVHAFRDGREVDRFVGALPEASVRAWLDRLGPTPADLAVQQAMDAEARGDPAAATEAYKRALAEAPGDERAHAGLARASLSLRLSELDENELRDRIALDPLDIWALAALADVEFAHDDVEPACARLIDAIRRTTGDERERLRTHLVELLATLPPEDARARTARRNLAAALF